MRTLFISLIIVIVSSTQALAHTDQDLVFSVDVTGQKDEAKAASGILKAAKKYIKSNCPKKTKFQAENVSINIGQDANGKYTGNANYEGVCKIK